ncbi:methionine ABC transporter ATP-binding protein [Endozoicomonas sp. OPT23]|uniref:ABC transporter ATP-binding protein n=1 Tax=Endozoicomonas sp. OPT23 TaxID=2072845 RepID=UPI00129A7666|nr:ABC transporter ATP-binding protein [Endozoicomonas sp. OPT23]MRI32239.1 methionine ABC transporter ATP-binding protein [Endozoicomonas sp. OPT23]
MSHRSNPVVELENVQFSWTEDKPILDIQSLSITQGEKVFIRGPSGSGKTTLLGLLGGVLTPDSGSVKVLNTNLAQLPPAQRDLHRAEHTGFIFQMFNLIPYLSVAENITLPLSFAKGRHDRVSATGRKPEQEAARLLQTLGLVDPELLSRPVTELSIGQQQRVAAARALIGSPELLIADEPTSALDTDTREAFIKLLFSECESSGSTLMFVSHDSSLEPLFDRTIVLPEINRASQQNREAV